MSQLIHSLCCAAVLLVLCTPALHAQGELPGLGNPAPPSIDAAISAELSAALGSAAPLEYMEAATAPDGGVRVTACWPDASAVARVLRQLAHPGGRHAGMRVITFNPFPRAGAEVVMVTLGGRLDAPGGDAADQAYVIEQVAAAGVGLPTLRLERPVDAPYGRTITADVMFAATQAAFDAFAKSAAVFARVDRAELVPEMAGRHRAITTLTLRIP